MSVTQQATSQSQQTIEDRLTNALASCQHSAATYSSAELLPLLSYLADSGRRHSAEYDLICDAWWEAYSREYEAAARAKTMHLSALVNRVLPAIQADCCTWDSAELGELLRGMKRHMMQDSEGYATIYRYWLAKFPREAITNLVWNWLERFEREHGAFVGFLASDLISLYGGSVKDAVSSEQVEQELTRVALAGRLVRAELTDGWGMYAIAGWAGDEELISSAPM